MGYESYEYEPALQQGCLLDFSLGHLAENAFYAGNEGTFDYRSLSTVLKEKKKSLEDQ
jgi:hypothetical protein